MCGKNFVRRVIPFFAAFLIGVFIASFFVSIGRPGFGGKRAKHMAEDRQVRIENDRLRERISQLEEQMSERTITVERDFDDTDIRGLVPPPPLPAKPSAPHSTR